MTFKEFENIDKDKFYVVTPFFKDTGNRRLPNVDTIVLHWTGGNSLSGALDALTTKGYGYHFLIEKDGKISQGAKIVKNVSHAGKSYGPKGPYLNHHSIGISFIATEESPISEEAINSCIDLINELTKVKEGEETLNIKYLTGHHWISPRRKIDPYTLDFVDLNNRLQNPLKIWKTGNAPFPKGLSDCECLVRDDKGDCIKSKGLCIGPGGHHYSERTLTPAVAKDDYMDTNATKDNNDVNKTGDNITT